MSNDAGVFLAYGALMLGAVTPIYFAAYSSLRTPATTKALRAKSRKHRSAEDDDDDGLRVPEKVTSADAWLFPVFGSMVLFSLYLVFRYLDQRYINLLLSFYFGLLGLFSLNRALRDVLHASIGKDFVSRLDKIKVQATKGGEGLLSFTCTVLDLFVLVPLSLALIVGYIYTRHWVISNMLALSLALNAIALMEIDSFVTGSIMLGGLFVYDVFWVFGTEVMVSVARSFDAPIKIVWPKNAIEGTSALLAASGSPSGFAAAWSKLQWQFTMLGLGDIVIPGIFVALALRYDQYVASVRMPGSHFTRRYTAFPKPYFTATLIAYFVGLATTMAVMHVFKAAQPALLYLSPACVAAVALQSLRRGESKQVWSWTDGDDEEDKMSKDTGKSEGTKGKGKSNGSAGAAADTDQAATGEESNDTGKKGQPERRSPRKRRASTKKTV